MLRRRSPLRVIDRLRAGRPGCATLRLVDDDGEMALLKDFSDSATTFRLTAGAYMARREARAYRRLRGIEGVPLLRRRIGADGLLLQFVEGRNCLETETVTAESFARLESLLIAVRQRGVLHGDVRRNVLVDAEGKAFLIDFGASLVIPWWLAPVRSLLTRTAASYDARSIAKLKRQVAPQLLTTADQRSLVEPLPFESLVKTGETVFRAVVAGILRLLRQS